MAAIIFIFLLLVMIAISPLFGVLLIVVLGAAFVLPMIQKTGKKTENDIENTNVDANNNSTKKVEKTVGIIAIIIIIVTIAALFLFSTDSPGSSGGKSKVCQSCDREYTDSTNKNYIRHTNMCRLCYRNYCYAIGQTPTNYDK